MGFTIIHKETPVIPERILLGTEKMALTDVFVESTNIEDFYRKTVLASCHYDRIAITKSYRKKEGINDHVLKLMRKQVLITPEETETDKETGEVIVVKEAIYNKQPATLTELKIEAYKAFPDCAKTAFEYNIGKIVDWSDGTGTCNFPQFLTYFNE